MDRESVVARFEGIRSGGSSESPRLHKPIVLLYAIGRAVNEAIRIARLRRA